MVIDCCIMFATILLAIVAESRVALGVNTVGQLDYIDVIFTPPHDHRYGYY